jgi:hypothetical protein
LEKAVATYWELPVGLLMLIVAVVETFTGKVYGRGGIADSEKQPVTYWLTLVIQVLIGVYLIWCWFYRVP